MTDSEKPDEGKQEAECPNPIVTQPTAPPPEQPPATPNTGNAGNDPQPPQPILVRLVGGDDLKPFEQQTIDIARDSLAISKRTYWIAIFGFLAALAAAVFVGVQVYEMTKQTQILSSQSEGANAGALMDEINTRKQLDIVQQLATAAGKQTELTAKQFAASQQLIKSQRASITVTFAGVNNPITFHDGGLSIVFSVALKNIGGLAANKVKVRFQSYFSQWGEKIFSEPMRRQRDFCDKPNVLRLRPDLRDLRGLTSDDALTIIPGDTKELQINFGMGKPTDSDIIDFPPLEFHQPQTKRIYPIVVGCVDYQSGVMTEAHQTGFIFAIMRGRTLITLGEDVRREDVAVEQYFFGQGKSY